MVIQSTLASGVSPQMPQGAGERSGKRAFPSPIWTRILIVAAVILAILFAAWQCKPYIEKHWTGFLRR